MDVVFLQRPQDLLRGHGLVALHHEVPDEERAQEQACGTEQQSDQQGLPAAEAEKKVGCALPTHHGERAVQIFCRLAQGVPVPASKAAGEGGGGLPHHVPEGQLPGAAQI